VGFLFSGVLKMDCPKGAKLIPLTQGKFAIVDEDVFDYLNQWNWTTHRNGRTYYAKRAVCIKGVQECILMNRLILGLRKGDPRQSDHINHKGFDNRLKNLRICTRSQNQHNQKPWDNTSSKYKGVGWHKHKKKWRVRISDNYTVYCIGYFTSEIEAAKAYNKAAIKYHGEFATLNEIRQSIL